MLRNRKNKYTDLSVKSPVPAADGRVPTRLVYKLNSGREQVIDLTFFEEGKFPRKQMAETFAWYFWHALTAHAPSSRDAKRYALKKFNRFLNWKAEGGVHISSTTEITEEVLLEYQLWLASAGEVSRKTAHFDYLHIALPLNHLLTNRPQCLPPGLKIPPNDFVLGKYDSRTGQIISITDLGKITAAALREVQQIRETHALAKRLLAEGEERIMRMRSEGHVRRSWQRLDEALFYLIKEIGIESPPYWVAGVLPRHGLPRANSIINMYAPVTNRNLIPFLVLLFIRTAINVETLYHLKRDALTEHPLPLGLTNLKFEKPRAGSARNKMLQFPTHQKNGVVDLIKFLLEYTAPWVAFARPSEKEELFLYKAPGQGKNEIRSPGENFFQALQKFIKENNLPNFNFAQIRPTVATLIYLQTKDIFRVQRLLCHSSATTTIDYIKQEVARRQHDRQIHDGIESMFTLIMDEPSRPGKPTVFVREIDSVLETKVEAGEINPTQAELIKSGGCATGFSRCKNPLDSPIPGEQKGHVCRQLHMCVFCPNAWVFEEDLPKVIFYRDTLLADQKNFTEAAWDRLHGDAFREITEAILPSFSKKAVERASEIAREIFIPYPEVGAKDEK